MRKSFLSVLLATLGFAALFILGLLSVLASQQSRSSAGPRSLDERNQDPAILAGAGLPAFQGAPITELVLYVYRAGAWEPIAFQIDEVTSSGIYTPSEDGLLDSNDELVFMGSDAGTWAGEDAWVADASARLHPRYAITVSDPLQPAALGFAYLYRSLTLARSPVQYVAWDEAASTVSALSYTLSFSPGGFVGLADLTLNGYAADLLDRQKIRVRLDNPFPIPDVTLNEEDLLDLLGEPLSITLPIVGPVRAVGGGGASAFGFYGARLEATLAFTASDIPLPLAEIAYVRVSMDLRDPAATGFAPATYYDSNTPSGVPIDGAADAIDPTPPVVWYQTSGAMGGIVSVVQVDAGDDSVSNYYRDDATFDQGDTGDHYAYADAGIRIDRSGDTVERVQMAQRSYVLPLGTGNLGDVIQSWVENPLVAETLVQRYEPQARIYLPLLVRP